MALPGSLSLRAVTADMICCMRAVLLLLVGFALDGCASRPATAPARQTETTMPNPDGCFVQVWDQPDFRGVFDYINGPQHHPSLRDMPGGRVWSNRIHSAKVGPDATVILYVDENARGASITLRTDTEYRTLPLALRGTAESLTVACASKPDAAD
jgi:hypothetical protein